MVERGDCFISPTEYDAILKVVAEAFHDVVSERDRGFREKEERRGWTTSDGTSIQPVSPFRLSMICFAAK
jgi:hypothetical protein